MTATLPQTHIRANNEPPGDRSAVVSRWHYLRRIAGVVTLGLATITGIVLAWPAMAVVALLGAGLALDAEIALRKARSSVAPTLIADITFTGVALAAAFVPPAAIGMVVAYYVLVIAVLGRTINAWPIGLYAVVVGAGASFLPDLLATSQPPVVRSLVAGIIVIAVFGLSTIEMVREFTSVRRRGNETTGRRIEVAKAIADASKSLVSEDEVGALSTALQVMREAMGVTAVFVERNADDPELGPYAELVDRAIDSSHVHPSLDRRAKVPWSAMPGARAHLEGGAPFFYRVEETRGTTADRGGEGGLQVEVNVPIVMRGRWIGVVGAADSNAERVWNTDDLLLLRTLADLTAAFWQRLDEGRVRDSLIGTLDGRLQYEEGIAKASQALLGQQAGGLETALEAVATATGSDHAYVTATSMGEDGEPEARVIAVWSAPGLEPAVDVDDVISYRRYAEAREAFQRGDLAIVTTAEVSSLASSIEVGGAWSGSVAFVAADPRREWSPADESYVRTLGGILGAYYERAQIRARLEASLASKDQLIASVSHELRTPLTAVVGLADELRSAGDLLDVTERDQLLGLIADESSEMADLVEDLLVAARSEDGSLPVFPERVDLALLCQSVHNHLAVPEDATIVIDDVDSVAFADPVRVRQIVRNLFTNAFRYGGDEIVVSFGRTDDMAHLDVYDDGPGIDADDRAAIFEPYGRASSGGTVKASVGLGLTLSRRLARLMGGDLAYVDGDGCTFRLTVPLPTPEDP